MSTTPAAGHRANVKDATFVTRSLPDISYTTGLVGICTVPQGRSSPNDLGWHISDFLAFKSLAGNVVHSRAQTWLAHCDIATIVSADPDAYAHGKDRRVFRDEKLAVLTSDVQVKSSADELVTAFLNTVREKAEIVRKSQFNLVVIICGPTNLEQDIYFGTTNYEPRICSPRLRDVMGAGDEGSFRATVVTPAQFSAGWQVNPCFCKDDSFQPRADRMTFLAKQLGAIFAKPIAEKVLSWECPMIDLSKVDPEMRRFERYPGPVPPPIEHKTLMEKVHKALAARLMFGHDDHSFSFDADADDWEKLIGARRGEPLDAYKRGWETLGVTTRARSGMPFLGNLFGGTKYSQLAHIEHLVMESLATWQGVWTNAWGTAAEAKFRKFLGNDSLDDSDYHEMFNVMEQRASLLVMADLLVTNLKLPGAPGKRCREHAETVAHPGEVGKAYDQLCVCVPWVSLDMDRGADRFSYIQGPHRRQAQYLAAVLGCAFENSTLKAVMDRILKLIQAAQSRQFRLLFEDPDFNEKCQKWLAAIRVPMRERPVFGNVVVETPMRTDKSGFHQDSRAGVSGPAVGVPNSAPVASGAGENRGGVQPSASPVQVSTGTSGRTVENSPAENSGAVPNGPSVRERCMAFLNGNHDTPSVEVLQAAFHECPDLTAEIIDRMKQLGAERGNTK